MPRQRARFWEDPPPPPPKRKHPLRTAWNVFTTLWILAIIAYVTGWFVGRTDGFRSIVEQHLARVLGFSVRIARVSVDGHYNLTLEDVRSDDASRARESYATAQRIKIHWRWRKMLATLSPAVERIEVDRLTVAFQRDELGQWAPVRMVPLGKTLADALRLPIDPDFAGATNGHPPSISGIFEQNDAFAIRIRRGNISWWPTVSAPSASMESLNVDLTPIDLPGRLMIHGSVTVKRVASLDGPAYQDVAVEWLDLGDRQISLRFDARPALDTRGYSTQMLKHAHL